MYPRPLRSRTLQMFAALVTVTALGGCDDSPAGPEESALLETVRQETARFASTAEASRAGYQANPHCVAHPDLGGMGHHWINPELVDPAFDALQPEVLLYAPDAQGNLQLVGVEYIVVDQGQEHPRFEDHPFDIGGVKPLMEAGVPHWSLHVWVHRANPSGVFAPFNPDVTCP